MNGKITVPRRVVFICLLALLPVQDLYGLISAKFTPIDLTKQSETIVELKFDGAVVDGKTQATVERVLKGKVDRKNLGFDFLGGTLKKGQAEGVLASLKIAGAAPAILFIGDIQVADAGNPGGGEVPPAEAEAVAGAFMHVGGQWIALKANKEVWEFQELGEQLFGTWQGGSDMLIRAVEYVLADKDAFLPVGEDVSWDEPKPAFAKIEGPITRAIPVDLAGNGKQALYLCGDKGDHLFEYDAKSGNFTKTTAAHKLVAKSRKALWGDFNADGRMDLLSWDGQDYLLCLQGTDGTLAAGASVLKEQVKGECLSLSIVDCGVAGHPGVLVSTPGGPVIAFPNAAAQALRTLPDASALTKNFGKPAGCLIADFDTDAMPDVLWLFEKGSVIYKGKSVGQFQAPEPCAVAMGASPADAFLGDYDADGLFDVLCAASDQTRVWQNCGSYRFEETLRFCGEAAYKADPGAFSGMTGDINNDGRQDFMLLYPGAAPRVFFSRGFRSFGLANGLDINKVLPEAGQGVQAGCWADFNGDGSQDLALVLADGEGRCLFRGGGGGVVRAALDSKGPNEGPAKASGWRSGRCLGAWNVTAGTAEAFIGVAEAGPMTVQWQFPGGKVTTKEVVVENRPVRVVVAP